MFRWRVYYGDDTTFDWQQGTPFDIPVRINCQHIVCEDPRQGPEGVGRFVVSGKDYYWFEDDEWWGGDVFGLYDYLARPGPKVVLFGRSLKRERWLALYRRAHDDPDFPPKSAYPAGEYHPSRARAQNED